MILSFPLAFSLSLHQKDDYENGASKKSLPPTIYSSVTTNGRKSATNDSETTARTRRRKASDK